MAVILIHVCDYIVKIYSPYSIEFKIANFIDTLSRFAVPFFFMISGIFMLDKKRELPIPKLAKKIFRTFALLVFWTFVYMVLTPEKRYIYHIMYAHEHLWFLRVLIGLYLMTPILRLFVTKKNINYLLYLAVLALIFQNTPEVLDTIFCRNNPPHDLISFCTKTFRVGFYSHWMIYYIGGWLIIQIFNKLKKHLSTFKLCAILGALINFAGMQAYQFYGFNATLVFYDDSNIGVFLYSVSLFILVKYFIDKYENKLSTKFKDLIFKFSGLSFGVYICHFAVLSFVRNYIRLTDYNILVYIVLVFGCTALLTTLLVLVLSKIKYVRTLIKF